MAGLVVVGFVIVDLVVVVVDLLLILLLQLSQVRCSYTLSYICHYYLIIAYANF